jgi:hypothetical protein
MAKRGKGRPASGLERVKWTPRVDPADLETFQAVRSRMGETARRRVSDAEVFRLAVAALVASLPDATRQQLKRA